MSMTYARAGHSPWDTLDRASRIQRFVLLLAVALLALAVVGFMAVRLGDEFATRGHADEFAVDGAAEIVIASDIGGRIAVQAGDAGTARITSALRGTWRLDYRIRRSGNLIQVDVTPRGFLGRLGRGPNATIDVAVPATTRIDVRAKDAPVQVAGIHATTVVQTTNSAVSLTALEGTLNVQTTNGRIDARGIHGSGKLITSNGAVNVEDADGEFIVQTTNGPVAFAGMLRPGTVTELRTTNGPVTARLGTTASVRLDAATTNGTITSRLPLLPTDSRAGHLAGTIGNGEAMLQIRTTNGAIAVQ